MSENAILAALRRMGYTKDEMTGHGFRSMTSTLLHAQGWNHHSTRTKRWLMVIRLVSPQAGRVEWCSPFSPAPSLPRGACRGAVIERQLAHAERNAVSAAYNFAEHLRERREMMQAWVDYLDGLNAGAEVILLFKKA